MMWFRRGSREDPVVLDKRLTAIERQLSISPIVAGGTGTGLIVPGGGVSAIYEVVPQKGLVTLATTGKYRVPFACTLTSTYITVTTASSSGSIVVNTTVNGSGTNTTTLTSGNTVVTGTLGLSLVAGDMLRFEITSAGTDAQNLVFGFTLVP